jgi:hypothetical protein
MEEPTLVEAIKSLDPDAGFKIGNNNANEITWLDGTTPISASDIETEYSRLISKYDAQAYARNRQYPPLGDQLDDLYHAGVFSAKMTAKLKKVKDDNPK